MDSSSSDENSTGDSQPLPHIEARVLDKNVLIRIHCVKCKGILVKALEETEKLNLTVTNSSSIPFGSSTLDITLLAQMDDEFIMSVKDLGESLRTSLIQFSGPDFP